MIQDNNSSNFNLTQNSSSNQSSFELCSVPPSSRHLAISVILMAICFVTFCGNLAVCATVYFHRALRTTTNYLIVSLAFADLLVSLFSMPFRIHFTIHNDQWCLNLNACALWIWMDLVVCSSSIGSLAAVSIERFVAVKYPLRYPALMTQQTGLKMICFVWSYSVIFASLGKYNWTFNRAETFAGCNKSDPIYFTVVASLAFFLPVLIVIVAYSYLTKIAFQQRRRTLNNTVRPGASPDPDHKSFRRSRVLQELKAAKMMACVVGIFCLSWVPFFILLLLSFWDRDSLRNMRLGVRDIFVTILPNLNSSVNPFLYMAFTRELREQVTKMVKKLFCKPCCKDSRVSGESSVQTRSMTLGETDIRQSIRNRELRN
ncbi:alpha-1A adrenergic receptor-like [Oculina patagonica]